MPIEHVAYKLTSFLSFEDSESPEFEQDYQEVYEVLSTWIREIACGDEQLLYRAGVR